MCRITIPIYENWSFKADPASVGISQKWYEQGLPDGQHIRIPHTWNIQEELVSFRGTGWYAHSFFAAPAWADSIIRLQFDAVYRDVVVWVNGQRAGEHTGSGYTTFILDISTHIQLNTTNLIVVSVNNENSMTAFPQGKSFDWADDGGIIRGVSLLVTGQIAIDYSKLKATPIFTEEGLAEYGTLSGELQLYGLQSKLVDGASIGLAVQVYDGEELVAGEEYLALSQNGRVRLQELQLVQPRLWHFDHPNLYRVYIAISLEGQITDELYVHVGFREIMTEGSKLLLNREPVRLMGVEWMPGSHPERGMGETEEQWIEVLQHIKQANCVITRFHWQQDSKLLDWCDRNGLLVQEEIPHWSHPHDPSEEYLYLSRQHAEEMIHRHYNHPCIYAWGMANEVNGQSPTTLAYFEKLKIVVTELDDTRLITYMSNTFQDNPTIDTTRVGDVFNWNDYIGTWMENLDRQEVLRQIDELYPDKPLFISEFGLCEPRLDGGDPRRLQILTENVLEYRKNPNIAAIIYFSLNDYRTQMGEFGVGSTQHQRIHGSMDCYGNPKPSYEALKRLGSPIELKVQLTGEAELQMALTIRQDIPSYRIAGYTMRITHESNECISLDIPALSPGASWSITIPHVDVNTWQSKRVQVNRPTGFSVLEGPIAKFAEPPLSQPVTLEDSTGEPR